MYRCGQNIGEIQIRISLKICITDEEMAKS